MQHPFQSQIKSKASQVKARIVFPEGNEERVIEAAEILAEESNLELILLKEDPKEHEKFEAYALLYKKRREELGKTCTLEQAKEAAKDPHTFATLMVLAGEADGMVAGPSSPSKVRILPALKLLRQSKDQVVSGAFFMLLPSNVDEDAANGGLLLFADCAVTVDPNSEQLSQIAISSAKTAQQFGLDPKIAMLSFSTEGSSSASQVDKVKEAAKLVRSKEPSLDISDDIQVDAALMDEIGAKKAPHTKLAGHANVLIFPDLEAGNIAYKLVERLAGATALGPILQGLQKPVNEVSRGASAKDIVNVTYLTALQSQKV